MKKTVAVVVVVLSVGLAAPSAAAITRDDPDDVEIRLDLARVSLACYLEAEDPFCEVGVKFHERVRVTPSRIPVTRFLLDAFGSSAPDFVIRFRYSGSVFLLGCVLMRLSDHAVLAASDVEQTRRRDSYYTQIQAPGRLTADADWRVTAALHGDVHDAAPDAGRYRHL